VKEDDDRREMEEVDKPDESGSQVKNIIVVLKNFNGEMLFLYSPKKQWRLPRIQMQADNIFGEFNQLFTMLGLPKEAIIENLQGIFEISTLPGIKFPFEDSDAVWLYVCPESSLNLSGQYREYKWVHSLSELNSLGLANIHSEIFKSLENFKLRAPKSKRKSIWRRFWRRGSGE
jgi:hypothetical protein